MRTKTAHWYIVSSLLLKHVRSTLPTSLCSGFRNGIILEQLSSKALNNMLLFSHFFSESRIYETKFQKEERFFIFPLFSLSNHFSFPSTIKSNVGDCSHVITLAVSC